MIATIPQLWKVLRTRCQVKGPDPVSGHLEVFRLPTIGWPHVDTIARQWGLKSLEKWKISLLCPSTTIGSFQDISKLLRKKCSLLLFWWRRWTRLDRHLFHGAHENNPPLGILEKHGSSEERLSRYNNNNKTKQKVVSWHPSPLLLLIARIPR